MATRAESPTSGPQSPEDQTEETQERSSGPSVREAPPSSPDEGTRAWWQLGGHVALLLVAAVMRLWDLGSRAMHHDESLHAFYSWNLYSGEGYQHDPMMHGPLQMEATAGLFYLLGDSDYTARLLYAVAGTALVALPFFLRRRLGNVGALIVSAMLAFSPAMLYFSRFARNDILMAAWTLGLVVCVWRYLDEGKHRYLYIASGLLALAFASKETAYLVTATLGLYLFLVVTARNWDAITKRVPLGEVSPPSALARLLDGVWSVASRGLRMKGLSRPAELLVLLATLSLPLGAASVSVLQDTALLSWSGLVLASPVDGGGPIGAPLRGGMVIAGLVTIGLLWLSAMLGSRWKGSVWWGCAGIFYGVWITLYSTFFTHLGGVGSGMWQSLGYWLVQQGEARGGQPLYYYLVITPLYEFLPLFLAIAGAVYYIRRRDSFGQFLVYWAAITFLLYTVASEKMPWLLVNVTLPLIVLGGRFAGDAIQRIHWRRVMSGGGWLVLAGWPVFLVLAWRLAPVSVDWGNTSEAVVVLASLGLLAGLIALGVSMAVRLGPRNFALLSSLAVAAVLVVLSVRAGWYASYRNGDVPVEMMVYTQTSPDIVRLLRHVEKTGDIARDGGGLTINIDQTSGFSWPWAWYLRDGTAVGYTSYDASPLESVPDSSVQLVHSNNQRQAEPLLADNFTEGTRVKHRWWFPENYRGVTVGKFLGALVDRSAWRRTMDYFLHRKLDTPLGSEDAYVYFSRELATGFTPRY